MKQELLKAKIGSIAFIPYVSNRAAVATSATVTVTDPGGTEIVSAQSCTIDSTTGEISYSLSAVNTATLGENYGADFTYVINSITHYQKILFDVVLNKLAITVVDDDLIQEQSDIMDRAESVTGTVDSAANTTIVDSDLKSFEDDFWNGGTVSVINPATGVEQKRTVSDFAQTSGTVTVSVAWATTPDSTYQYIVRRGFKTKIEHAFDEMMFDIKSKGFRPALILESSELHVPHVKKTLAIICRDCIQAVGDKFDALADKYETQYKDLMARIVLQYDKNESGLISAGEKDQDVGSMRLRR